jgi:hypothetical protein
MGENKIINKDEQTKHNNNIRCEICGTIYHKSNRARHERTKKHKDVKYVWIDRIEILR